MFTPPNVSRVICHVSLVTCHVSLVTCHVSRVTCHMSLFFRTKWWSLSVEGLLSTGPTQSSFYLFIIIVKECYQTTSNQQTSQCKHLNAATKLKQFELGQMYRTTSMFNFFKTPKIWKDLKFAYLG